MSHPQPSRRRYRAFVQDYKQRRLDDGTEPGKESPPSASPMPWSGKRRDYLRDYLRWLWPHRFELAGVFVLALIVAGLEMIEPLFMRFIIDRVLLNTSMDTAARLSALHLAGTVFVAVILLSNLTRVLKDYRQKLLNAKVMLSLRQSLFDRLLHLPLSKLWDMKTGGILSRLTGDVETTTGLLQMAVISPTLSLVRLIIAVTVLMVLNWRLALTALTIIPGVMVMSFAFTRRIRPIYRSVRKDAESIDGRVGETFSGIRVVRAFARETRELVGYMLGRHTVLRKELFAHRRELIVWTSWGLLTAAVNVVIVWYGGYLNVINRATIGDIMAFQWYTFLLMNPVWNIVNSFSELQRSLAAMERVFEVLGMQNDKPDRPDARDAPTLVHEIRFEDVEFEYREGHPVVRDFNVVVPGGSVVALVGRSGAGKTTVTDLVARFHDPTRGRILLNGTDIREFRLSTYREAAGHRPAGRVPVRWIGAGQHRLRPAGCLGRGSGRRRAAGQRPRVHRAAARGLRDVHRRAWRQALRRTAAAAGDCEGRARVAADPHPGRGHEQPGHGERTADSGVDGHAARRPDHVRHRASSVDHPPRRPDPADGGRQHHRKRHARRADERSGHVLPDGSTADAVLARARGQRGARARSN